MTDENPIGPQSNYYIGDWPQPAYPVYPGIPVPQVTPGVPSTSTLFPKMPTKEITIFIIWGITPDFPDRPFALAVWDEELRDEDPDGFEQALADHEETYGARNVRITRSKINYDAVISAFGEQEI